MRNELTKAEKIVALKVLDGNKNAVIAAELFVTVKTVKFHTGHIYKKLNVTSRAEFMARYHNDRNFFNRGENKMERLPTRENTQQVERYNNQDKISQQDKINYIDEKFKVGLAIEHLHGMMKEVTSKDLNAVNVNAACNCVARINETINTAIQAARFLNER